jgi:predicted ATPase/serine/threonine protein kinase
MLKEGVVIGGTYKLDKLLGQGGWGAVWRAEHVLLKEYRAIKVMLGQWAADPAARSRFIEGEARNTLRLERHPNIVRCYELGLHDDMPYIVMEFVEGTTLHALLKAKGKLNLRQTARALEQISAGLEVAHKQGLVHRDIKPGNILINRENIIKVSDFGLTKDLEAKVELTNAGYTVGTITYIAPEQAKGFPEIRSDVYALGVMTYEMLAGRTPFVGAPTQVLLQHLKDEPPLLRSFEPTITPEVEAVVMKTLQKRPADRYQSVKEFSDAFHRAAFGEPSVTQDTPTAKPIPVTNIAPPTAPATPGNLPTGLITFLFTDIEGSTKLWEEFPDAMRGNLARHDRIMRQAIEEQQGYVFKTVGDAFCAAFSSAQAALDATVNAQRALANENWGVTGGVRVRMGLHTGTAEERDNDYFGPTLNRAARLMSAGHGGQILISGITQDLLRGYRTNDISWRDLGHHRLKDLSQPEHIFQVVSAGLETDFPPIKTLDTRLTNLPIQPAPLIGRDREMNEICELLNQPENRLVTLLGPGGTGKTSLSLQVGAESLDGYKDGVFFVPLEPVTEPDSALVTLAQVLSLKRSERPLLGELKAYLKDKQMLLIMDNFEQAVSAAPLVGELLQAAGKLKMLVSSRIALRVYGEKEYPVPPLALPNLKKLPPVAELENFSAVALFVQRARMVKPDFKLTPENAKAVVEICARLDGLPLAIELAAARSKLLPPQALLSRLDNRLKVLTGGATDRGVRQQTLRGAIDWSYDLLEEPEKRFFARMGVFAKGCTLEAAETVVGAITPDLDVLDGISSLVDKSLLRQEEPPRGYPDAEPRFVMLETIREYALDRLTQNGENETLRGLHAEYYRDYAENAEEELRGTQQVAWLKRLETEHENFRSALKWTVENEPETALRLGNALWRFWVMNSHFSEGRTWLDTILNKTRNNSDLAAWRVLVLNGAGNLAWVQGDYTRATGMLDESRQLSESHNDTEGVASVVLNLGNIALEQGDYERAKDYYTQNLELRRLLGNRQDIANALQTLGNVALETEEFDEAKTLFDEALKLFTELKDKQGAEMTRASLRQVERFRR